MANNKSKPKKAKRSLKDRYQWLKHKLGRSKVVRGAQRIINPEKAKSMDEMDAYYDKQNEEARKKTEIWVDRTLKDRGMTPEKRKGGKRNDKGYSYKDWLDL
jgi:hypothetical protein